MLEPIYIDRSRISAAQKEDLLHLSSDRSWRSGGCGGVGGGSSSWWRNCSRSVTVDFGGVLWALPGDVTGLSAAVAGLAGGVKRTTVRGGAVAGNVTELSASIALHGLSLAVTGKVVWTTAFVAGSGAVDRGETTTETAKATTGWRSTTTSAGAGGTWGWARTLREESESGSDENRGSTYSDVADLSAGVAATARRTTVQAKSWAISLDVAEALAVVTLLGLGGAWVGAVVGLVAFYISSASCRTCDMTLTNLAACSYSRGARKKSKPRRSDRRCRTCSKHDEKGKTFCIAAGIRSALIS